MAGNLSDHSALAQQALAVNSHMLDLGFLPSEEMGDSGVRGKSCNFLQIS